jgi:hypothetical protein
MLMMIISAIKMQAVGTSALPILIYGFGIGNWFQQI